MFFKNIDLIHEETGLINCQKILNDVLNYPYHTSLLFDKHQIVLFMKMWKLQMFLDISQTYILNELIFYFEKNIIQYYNKRLTLGEFTIQNNNYNIDNKKTFLQIWNYIYTGDENILITENIINIIYRLRYKKIISFSNIKYKQDSFFNLLQNFDFKNIHVYTYEEINWLSPKAEQYPYIINEIQNTKAKNICFKKWIIMSKSAFIEIMITISKDINLYYKMYDQILSDYQKYLKMLKTDNKYKYNNIISIYRKKYNNYELLKNNE